VGKAWERRQKRNPGGCSNAALSAEALRRVIELEPQTLKLWTSAIARRRISARGAERLLRVALTISDLDGTGEVGTRELVEALSYRSFDQQEE
jgi:magnesium chelatase family protein